MYDIIINAPNIRSGGGLTLLEALFFHAGKINSSLFIVNERIPKKLKNNNNLLLVRHSLFARVKNEFLLKTISVNAKKVLMFGNLPPIHRLHCETIIYIQNVYIIKKLPLAGFNWKQKFRITMERLWFNLFKKNVDRFVVQTHSMKQLLEFKGCKNVEIIPFAGNMDVQCEMHKHYEYIYPSSGEIHKNHRNLIEAWVQLANVGIYPELYLTLNKNMFRKLWVWIEKKIKLYNLKITNLGQVDSHRDMLCYIKNSKCLIFPSLVESFGLPLVEAQYFNIPIVAAEREYVRDVVFPVQTFDPDSPVSIARAVKRHLAINDMPLPIYTSEEFFDKLEGR